MNYMHRKNIALLAVLLILVLSTAAFADSIIIKASASPKKGGTISPSGKVAVNPGENLQFTITPNTGYQIKDVVVDGVSQGATNVYTFANITEKHSLKAKFAKKTFTVEIADGGKVSVSPVGTKTVTYGKKITLKIKPESEDVVPILLVNGKPVEAKKSGNVYNYVLTPVGDTSVYATSEVEPKLTPGTKIMDEVTANNLISISEDGTVLTFTGVTPYLESLQPDDVMVSTFATDVTPYGLLRKVTNVVIDDPQVTVETTDATVEDVLEEGEIIVNKALTAYDITSFVPLVEGVTLQEAIPGPIHQQGCLTLNKVLYDADGNNNTTNDQVVLNGSACLDPSYHFSLGMGWKHKWGIPYPAVKNLVFAVGLSESIALELDAHYTQTFSKEIPIAVIGYGAIVVGPLVFIPVQTVYVGIDGSISAGITAGINQYAGLELGLSYHNSKWAPIANFTSGFDYHLPALNYLDAQVEVYAGSEFRFMLYGVAGSYVNLTGYFDLEMGSFSNQWLNIFAGIKAGAGFKAGIWGFEIKKDWPNLFNHYELLAQQYAAINQPPTITSLTANPSNVLISKTSTITVVASDPDGDPLTCAWSKDGGTLSSTTGCGSVTWTAPGTPGTYTVSISITDNKAGHSPITWAVTITVSPNQPPTITSLIANPSNVLVSKTSTITVVASDPDGDPLTCTWSKDGGTLSSTTGCGSVTWTAPGTPGSYAVYVNVTDNKEGHSPITWAVTIPVTAEPICVPQLSSPANGSVLDNGCSDNSDLLTWNFAWTACSGATQYNIYVKHPNNAQYRVDANAEGTNYQYKEYTYVDRHSGWRWKVRAMVNKFWGNWSEEGTFDVEPKNTDCNQPPTITSLTADPQWVPSGGTLTVTVITSDPENDPLTCTWSKNKGTLSSTTGCGSVTWTAPGGSGHAAITVSVTDNKEGHSPIVWSIQVSYGCTYTVNPTSASYSASGGFGSVEVTAPSGCPWSVTFDAPWIYPAPVVAVNETGNGTVHYQVEANSSAQSRTGTITIAEQTFTVTQEAAPCAYEINPTGALYYAYGGSGIVNVTTNRQTCTWSATSNAPWITITSVLNGKVQYSVGSYVNNPTLPIRTGTMTIAGKTFTISQVPGVPPK